MKRIFCIGFIIILLIGGLKTFGQTTSDTIKARIAIDTTKMVIVETADGKVFPGVVIYEDNIFIILRTKSNGDIVVPKEKLKSTTELKAINKNEASDEELIAYYKDQGKLNHKYEVAKKTQKTGTILTFSGLAAIGIGYGLFQYGYYQKTPTSDTRSVWTGNIGVLLFSAGLPTSCIGVIVLLAGTDQKAAAKKKLNISLVSIKSPMISKSVNGLTFSINF